MNRKRLLAVLEGCGSIVKLKKIHACAVTLGLLQNHQSLASNILTVYTKLGHPQHAHKLFNQIQDPDIVSWTSLIYLHLREEDPNTAFLAFSRLINRGLRPDSYSVVGSLCACGLDKSLLGGKVVHGMVLRFQLGLDPIVGNALIDMYSRNGEIEVARRVFEGMGVKDIASWNTLINGFVMCGYLEGARDVFDEMPLRNWISWTAMMTGYVRGKAPVIALKLFKEMKIEGKNQPTAITVVSVLSGCSDIGALDFGSSIHGYVNKTYLTEDVTVSNALMDMYSKSGDLDVSLKIFGEIGVKKDVFSWTTMISAYATHGKAEQALEVFSAMLESGVAPNKVTFLSVLSACTHAGLVTEGQRLFQEMVVRYRLKPRIEHYGCLLDLLSRAGHLEEAKILIDNMPVSRDAPIWRSFLSACLLHGNLNLAEMAGKRVVELEPDDDGVNVLLWQICSAANRQEDGLKIRKLMRNHKVKKKPGCSWLELNGVIHELLAEDALHQDVGRKIHWVLDSIREPSKLDFGWSCLPLEN
ncbi:hypothetical protein SLEP1_g15333 [Rubroshorea leprosula]|uniref:Pentatricopeptide repeat-containing protein n=1 Tax=Rubroshorea leprosula TaxID=152421 RepID=A0AAV5IM16_9ROSI|nr:hypothetical protein SLEP1_g15333 [Rubroshorea leprosula]